MRFLRFALLILTTSLLIPAPGTGRDNSDHGGKRVLLAHGQSPFWPRIVSRLSDHLGSKPVYLETAGLRVLDSLDGREWDAMVIVHLVAPSREKRRVQEYLGQPYNRANCLVIPTPGLPEEGHWDTETRASLHVELEAYLEFTLTQLDGLLRL